MGSYRPIPDGLSASQIACLQELYMKYIGFKTDGFFVEIGAFDGYSWSNTYCLIDAGWHGIMVEPHPEHYGKLVSRHGRNPNLKLVNAAIGKRRRKARLYTGGSLSTTKLKSVKEYPKIQGMNFTGLDSKKSIQVQMITMDDLLLSNNCPALYDVLVVDVEGAELDVLKWNDLDRWRPELAIIEAHEQHPDSRLNWKAPLITAYMEQNDYEKVYADIINSVYLNRRKND